MLCVHRATRELRVQSVPRYAFQAPWLSTRSPGQSIAAE